MEKVVSWLLILVGVIGTWLLLLRPVSFVIDARGWTAEQCQIRDSGGTESTATRALTISYTYVVGGREFSAGRYSFLDGVAGKDLARKRRILEKNSPGRIVTCYVDPKNAESAVLNRSFTSDMLLGLIPLFLLAIGLVGTGLVPAAALAGLGRTLLERPRAGRSGPDEGDFTGEAFPAAPPKPSVSNSPDVAGGLVAGLGLTGLAIMSFLASIGDELSNPAALALNAVILAALTYGYHRGSLASGVTLLAYPAAMAVASFVASSWPQATQTLMAWLVTVIPVPSLTPRLVQGTDALARYAQDAGSTSILLLPIGVFLYRGLKELARQSQTNTIQAIGMAAAPAVAIVILIVAAGFATLGIPSGDGLPGAAMSPDEIRTGLAGNDAVGRQRACQAIWSLNEIPADMGPDLLSAASQGKGEQRGMCVGALGKLGAAGEPAIPLLRKAMRQPSMYIRLIATTSLATIGGRSGRVDILADLEEAADDPEAQMRTVAIASLGAFGEAAQGAIPLLKKALTDPAVDVRDNAAQVLGALGPAAAAATKDLALALRDPDPRIRRSAAQALTSIGPPAYEAVPALNHATADPVEEVRGAAFEALDSVTGQFPEVVNGLAAQLSDPSHEVRAKALIALEKMGPGAALAVPAIVPLLSQSPIYIRVFAVDTLTAIGPAARASLPRLKEMVDERLITYEIEAQRLPETLQKALRAIEPKT